MFAAIFCPYLYFISEGIPVSVFLEKLHLIYSSAEQTQSMCFYFSFACKVVDFLVYQFLPVLI